MKTNNNKIFISAMVIFLFTACQQFFTKEAGNAVAVIVDCSDTFPEIKQDLTLNNLKPLLVVTHQENSASVVFLAKSNEMRNNTCRVIKIDGEVAAHSNTPQRKKRREEFYARLEENIQSITSGPTGTDGSFVLYAISAMLQKLKDCPNCDKGRRLLVFSDLEEHNPAVFSVYNPAHFKLLKENPDSAFAIFDREYPVPESTPPIEIVFIRRVENKQSDERYTVISLALKKYYEKNGYKVTISATIPEE